MTEPAQLVWQALAAENIQYQVVQHPPVYTAKQADEYVRGYQFARTKNLLLTDHHQHFYLVLLAENHRLDLRQFRQQAQTKRLSFASDAELQAKLGVDAGAVSPFGLLNNPAHDVDLYVDQSVLAAEMIGCHPNVNTSTVILKVADLLRVLTRMGFMPHSLNS